MSKADKMFYELEYRLIRNDKNIITYSYYGIDIKFKLSVKEVYTDGSITIKEHLAIHEKMKELGWL